MDRDENAYVEMDREEIERRWWKKIEEEKNQEKYIQTHIGIGYRMVKMENHDWFMIRKETAWKTRLLFLKKTP